MTVTASLNQSSVESMPLHTTVVSRSDIDKSPAQTLDQLLRSVPGFNFTGIPAALTDPTGQQTKMRGLGNAQVLVLLDGVPIMDPFYLTTQFYKVPLADVERIEVIRGGASSLWGSMAVAGVVNIVTRRPTGNSGTLTVGAGNQRTGNLAWSQNLRVSPKLELNLALNQYRTDGYLTTPAQYRWKFPQLEATRARDSNLELSVFFHLNEHVKGFVRAGYHRQDQNIGYRYGRNLQDNPDFAAGLDSDFGRGRQLTWRAWAQQVDFDKLNGATCYLQPAGGCLDSNSPQQTVSDEVVQYYTQRGALDYREQGTSLVYSQFVNEILNSFQVGFNYRHLSATDHEWFYLTPATATDPQVLNASGYGQGRQTFGGAFFQVRVSPFGPLQVTLSGRYDSWRNTGQLHSLTAANGGTSGGRLPAGSKRAFNPGLGLHYDLDNQWSLRAAAYKAFRAPGFNNTTRSYGVGPTTVANPDLGPETMSGWEAGADYRGFDGSFGVTFYSADVRNMIATYRIDSADGAPAPVLLLCSSSPSVPNLDNCGGSARYYTNDQRGRSRGVELNAGWQVTPTLALDGYLDYTHTWLTGKAAAITTPLDVQLAGVPRKTGSLGVTWKPVAKLRLYGQALYIGPMYLDETTTPSTYHGQGGAVVYNASAAYAVNDSLELTARVMNAFDRAYSENAYAINRPWQRRWSAPRTFFVSATYKY